MRPFKENKDFFMFLDNNYFVAALGELLYENKINF